MEKVTKCETRNEKGLLLFICSTRERHIFQGAFALFVCVWKTSEKNWKDIF
jgi:hypothetical protein